MLEKLGCVCVCVVVDAGLHAELSLPTIAVVGSQSVGKTSVLQSLVGLLAASGQRLYARVAQSNL